MEYRRVEIVQLQDKHADPVARLHLTWLPTQFVGTSGQGLLRTYYRAVACGRGASGFAAIDGEQVVGYICGIWDARLLQKTLVTKYGLSLFYWGLRHLVERPVLLSAALRRMRLSHPESNLGDYELRPIVVAATHRGTGLATRLVERLLSDAFQRGYSSVHLFCDPDNSNARKLYERHGFRSTQTASTVGQAYLRYSICIGTNDHER